jgi:hypothetical protein
MSRGQPVVTRFGPRLATRSYGKRLPADYLLDEPGPRLGGERSDFPECHYSINCDISASVSITGRPDRTPEPPLVRGESRPDGCPRGGPVSRCRRRSSGDWLIPFLLVAGAGWVAWILAQVAYRWLAAHWYVAAITAAIVVAVAGRRPRRQAEPSPRDQVPQNQDHHRATTCGGPWEARPAGDCCPSQPPGQPGPIAAVRPAGCRDGIWSIPRPAAGDRGPGTGRVASATLPPLRPRGKGVSAGICPPPLPGPAPGGQSGACQIPCRVLSPLHRGPGSGGGCGLRHHPAPRSAGGDELTHRPRPAPWPADGCGVLDGHLSIPVRHCLPVVTLGTSMSNDARPSCERSATSWTHSASSVRLRGLPRSWEAPGFRCRSTGAARAARGSVALQQARGSLVPGPEFRMS